MRIQGSPVIRPSDDIARLQHQARVLKKALEGQKDSASELVKMLDPKGQVLDIKA
jgi:hypothetical protein